MTSIGKLSEPERESLCEAVFLDTVSKEDDQTGMDEQLTSAALRYHEKMYVSIYGASCVDPRAARFVPSGGLVSM